MKFETNLRMHFRISHTKFNITVHIIHKNIVICIFCTLFYNCIKIFIAKTLYLPLRFIATVEFRNVFVKNSAFKLLIESNVIFLLKI